MGALLSTVARLGIGITGPPSEVASLKEVKLVDVVKARAFTSLANRSPNGVFRSLKMCRRFEDC